MSLMATLGHTKLYIHMYSWTLTVYLGVKCFPSKLFSTEEETFN